MDFPTLRHIWVYPIKSLDPLALEQVRITPGGSLQHDRRWGMVNAQGEWLNGKRDPRVHGLRAHFTLETDEITPEITPEIRSVTLHGPGHPQVTFNLHDDRRDLEAWLSDYFQESVSLQENRDQGFPDDLKANGPTIVSEATLEAVSEWFPGMTLRDTRLRFRANLELSAVPPFWEDQLFGIKGEERSFRLGSINFLGINPCLRCVVPARDPQSGTVTPHSVAQFVAQFVQQRRAHLPPWISDQSHFDNAYRLTVNTRIPESSRGGVLRVGDLLN